MDNPDNIIHQARFFMRTNWLQAVKVLEEGLKTFPDAKELYLELAEIYTQRKSYNKALQYYQKVVNIDPFHTLSRFKIANIYLDLDEPKLALYHYNKIDNAFPEAKYNKAVTFYRLQMYQEAIDLLKEVVTCKDPVHNAHFLLIELLLLVGKVKEAYHYIDKAVEVYGNTAHIHYLKGTAHAYQKNWLAAYNDLLQALPSYLDNPRIHQKLGIAAENIGRVDKAIAHLKDAISLRNDDKLSVVELIKILVKYRIVTDKDELQTLMKDHDKETVKMALRFYENYVLGEE